MMRFLAPIAIGVAGAAILLSLGVWQVQRLAWKNGVIEQIERVISAPPVSLKERIDPVVPFAPVHMTGQGGDREVHVLVSHKKLGPGFRVITAFATDEAGTVLLDLGFVPADDKEARRPVLSGRVVGNLHVPDDRNRSTPPNDPDANVWFARDVEQIAQALGAEPILVILSEVDGPAIGVTPMPVDTSAIPNDHLEYAITWFSLAAIWLGMTAYWLSRIRRREI